MSLTLTELVDLTKKTAFQQVGRPRLLLTLGEQPSEAETKILSSLNCKNYRVSFQPVKDTKFVWWTKDPGHLFVISQYLVKRLGHSNFILTEIDVVSGLKIEQDLQGEEKE